MAQMRVNTLRLSLVVLVVAVLGFTIGQALASRNAPAPSPPWVNEDSSIDRSKMPSRQGIADSNGNLVGWADTRVGPDGIKGERDATGRIPVRDDQGVVVGFIAEECDSDGACRYRFRPLAIEAP